MRTGPVLPDVRIDSGRMLGVDVTLGKTNAETTAELVDRYALIASQPAGSIARVESAVTDMAYDAALRGALVGFVPVAVWLLLGVDRRRELWRGARSVQGLAALTAVALAAVLVWEPWGGEDERVESEASWLPLPIYLGNTVAVPEQAAGLEILNDASAFDSRRLVESAVSTYRQSTEFYDAAAEGAAELDVRQPEEGETVAVLVSDRHDNIGMDRVARAIGDRAGATVVLDAGDDTSTGQPWEAFSLDSVSAAFDGYDRFSVLGNHDSGEFVADYLGGLGWDVLDGEVVDGPGGAPLIGLADPRSSGLGNWRDETGLSFTEVAQRFSDAICEAEERVATVLVHDVNLARPGARGRVHRPGRGRTRAREDRPEPGRGRQRSRRLLLHDRHDRRCGVRHRDRQQAAPRRDGLAPHLPRRPTGRDPAGHPADQRHLSRRGVRRARARRRVSYSSASGASVGAATASSGFEARTVSM